MCSKEITCSVLLECLLRDKKITPSTHTINRVNEQGTCFFIDIVREPIICKGICYITDFGIIRPWYFFNVPVSCNCWEMSLFYIWYGISVSSPESKKIRTAIDSFNLNRLKWVTSVQTAIKTGTNSSTIVLIKSDLMKLEFYNIEVIALRMSYQSCIFRSCIVKEIVIRFDLFEA